MRLWTEEEDEYLKQNCGKLSYKEMADYLDRPAGAIRTRVYNLGLSQKKRGPKSAIASQPWTAEEINYLKTNIRKTNMREMGFLLKRGRTLSAIRGKAQALNLYVDKWQLWTKEEDDYILKSYGDDVSYREMQKELPHRTISAIKARTMKLLSRF